MFTGEQLVTNDPHGIEIGRWVRSWLVKQFRGHVKRGTRRTTINLPHGRESKIEQPNHAVANQHIVGLEVTMQHPAPVQVGQRLQQLLDQFDFALKRGFWAAARMVCGSGR
jgi:hypothetical protein